MIGLLTFSGHALSGDRILRIIYLDAAGLSNPKHEPFIVVAGVVVHADKQWKAIAKYLSDMADEYAPKGHRKGFSFHATELFSGGKLFPRETYSMEWRWRVLDELVSLPEKFDLPVVWCAVPRVAFEIGGRLEHKPRASWVPKPVVHGQMVALAGVCQFAERYMCEAAEAGELAQMVMENDDQSRPVFKVLQRVLSDERLNSEVEGLSEFKLTRIIYPMHFEDKTDSSALQIADVCAFALKRWCMNAPEADRFYGPIERFLTTSVNREALQEPAFEGTPS